MIKFLLITQSSNTGINRKILDQIEDVILYNRIEVKKYTDPLSVSDSDVFSADKIIMVVPEWNGSFPYSFKQMIDDSGWPSFLKNKEILLIGTSNTTFGNIMGITHLNHILSWCGANVFSRKICIPNISNETELEDSWIEKIKNFAS